MSLLTVGTRQWDHVFPIALGDVRPTMGHEVKLARLEQTPNLWTDSQFDAGETSLSKYVRRRAEGDDSVVGLPIFVMRGFRHRCIIVSSASDLYSLRDLESARIGVTGWPDSGNTWTRALLTEANMDLAEIRWTVGRLTADHPIVDRYDGVVPDARFSVVSDEKPMVDALADGELDAVFTPFLPPNFSSPNSQMRLLFDDVVEAEKQFLEEKQYIPGIHILGVRAQLLKTSPDVPRELGRMFSESAQIASKRHRKLQDVTPWLNQAIDLFDGTGISDASPIGLKANERMLSDFICHMQEQGLVGQVPSLSELFPFALDGECGD